MCVCVCVCVRVRVCVYRCKYMYVCTYVWHADCICTCVRMYSMHVFEELCLYAIYNVHMDMYTCAHTFVPFIPHSVSTPHQGPPFSVALLVPSIVTSLTKGLPSSNMLM